ncbi:unnamed protein product [Ilex paraguariensis]|uniref:Uncharacterized protein n=1 Tax=Ilex paraguariensis TaxID=185542 RepID=A0ABC8SHN3_9AQUA
MGKLSVEICLISARGLRRTSSLWKLQWLAVGREPIFLRERLQGTATVVVKEFLDKYMKNSEVSNSKPVEEVGSFELRKRNSTKPQGFVDVSIRVSEERDEPSIYGMRLQKILEPCLSI